MKQLAPGVVVTVVKVTDPKRAALLNAVGVIREPLVGFAAVLLAADWLVDMPGITYRCTACNQIHEPPHAFLSYELKPLEDPDAQTEQITEKVRDNENIIEHVS